MSRVFVTRALPGEALERLRQAHEVEIWPGPLPPGPEQLRTSLSEAEGILTLLTDRLDATLIAAAPRLRAIANYAVGVDNIDLDAARKRDIQVGNTPDVLTEATADLAFALLLAAARRLPEALAAVAGGEWRTWEPARWLGAEVQGASIGIVGFGRIGRAVARRAGGFSMEVLHTGAGGVPLAELLARSDFVSLHCPLTAATRRMIDEPALAAMKPTAILINTARGPIVHQAALARALHEGWIAGAALDVTDPEPPRREDPLLGAPNLLVTPHIGSATRAARERMSELAVENLLAALDGRPMPHRVA
jgi:glyoxylate reductase